MARRRFRELERVAGSATRSPGRSEGAKRGRGQPPTRPLRAGRAGQAGRKSSEISEGPLFRTALGWRRPLGRCE
jgi:hypothetical protein